MIQVRKLILKKETVREIAPRDLREVAAGVHFTDEHGSKLCSACGVGYTCTCANSVDFACN